MLTSTTTTSVALGQARPSVPWVRSCVHAVWDLVTSADLERPGILVSRADRSARQRFRWRGAGFDEPMVFDEAALMLLGLPATGGEDDLCATTECALDRPETSSEPMRTARGRVRARFPGEKERHFAACGGERGRGSICCEEAEERLCLLRSGAWRWILCSLLVDR